MAAVGVISPIPTSFVYEDLISKVQTVHQQMIEMENLLENQWKTNKIIENELKSRSIVFVDHLGHRTVHKCLDHEQLIKVLKNYKKNYIPKYLQKWIKFGIMINNSISSLTDLQLKSTVSNFENGQEVHCFGEVNVSVGTSENYWPRKFHVSICLSDNMEKVIMQIKKQRIFTGIELRSSMINDDNKPTRKSWSEGTAVKSDDTVLSLQLFQNNSIILGKIIDKRVNSDFLHAMNHLSFC